MSDSALINEYKGNLFEFLVASDIAKKWGIEGSFLKNLNPALKEQLSIYERELRSLDPSLLTSLPRLAADTAAQLHEILPFKIDSVEVIGKISSGERWKEADILIDKIIPISLKLCKNNSFVNTKSAGIKSFISKYFVSFPEALKLQERLNHAVDQEFTRMGHELYELCGLDYQGEFDNRWPYPDRPGQLPEKMRQIVVRSYHKLIQVIYSIFEELMIANRSQFEKALLPLMGVGSAEIVQLSCFYKGDYQLAGHSVVTTNNIKFERLLEFNPKISSFELFFKELILQIRVKPMNRFNTPAFKINCSIKKRNK